MCHVQLRKVWDRIMGRSVRDLAGEVDTALGRLAEARGLEALAHDALRLAQRDVQKAEADVAKARDALFKEHPDLAPAGWDVTRKEPTTVTEQPSGPWDPDVVEVDDDNDPRFTGGAPAAPPPVTGDLPPIEWEEHDA